MFAVRPFWSRNWTFVFIQVSIQSRSKIRSLNNIEIKHDFLCINICWGPREVLKPETERKNTLPANVSRAKTNFTVTVHFTYDDVSFYDGPVTRRNSRALIALLIHGFVLVKTWLWIASGTAFNAFLHCYMTEEKSVSWLVQFSWINLCVNLKTGSNLSYINISFSRLILLIYFHIRLLDS